MDSDVGREVGSPGLQRKLFLILGPLVTVMLITAVVVIFLLQSVLTDLSGVNRGIAETGHTISTTASRIATIHAIGDGLRPAERESLEDLHREVRGLGSILEVLAGLDPSAHGLESRLAKVEALLGAVDAEIARSRDGDHRAASVHAAMVLAMSDDIGHEMLALAARLHDELIGRQGALVTRFRWIVVGLTIAFVVLVNVSVIVLLRTARVVLTPVHDLVDASRRLAHEDYSCRVRLQGRDEFDELANAFNDLAAQLQEAERRRMETLHQVGRAVNHELNNALSILELQLEMIERRPELDVPAAQLREIHETLERMSGTVRALGDLRRIVLTDYMPGTPMLDLERSSGTLDERPEGRVAVESKQ